MQDLLQIHTFPSENVQTQSAKLIAQALSEQLKTKNILMLLSGGSAIDMYKIMFQQLYDRHVSLKNMVVSLFDERYVTKGSQESNEQQLINASVIRLIEQNEGSFFPYLTEAKIDQDMLVQRISAQFTSFLKKGYVLVILAGIGEDGHTAGLLPVKPDSKNKIKLFETSQLVVYYQVDPRDSDNPFKERITSTPALIKQAESIFVYITGEKKRATLQRLMKKEERVNQMPAVCLFQINHQVHLFTDCLLE